MSIIPYLLNDVFDDCNRYLPQHNLMHYRPWRHLAARQSVISSIQNDKDGFKINLDVQQFKPNEVLVKMVDNCVVVEGKHEERQDAHGFISRQFQRRYPLPDDVDPNNVTSKLSSDGILTVEGPKTLLPSTNERVVPIAHTNAPAVTQAASQGDAKTKDSEETRVQ